MPEPEQKTVEQLRSFMNMFNATQEVDYLEQAIGVAEELVRTPGVVIPALDKMRETRERLRGRAWNPMSVET